MDLIKCIRCKELFLPDWRRNYICPDCVAKAKETREERALMGKTKTVSHHPKYLHKLSKVSRWSEHRVNDRNAFSHLPMGVCVRCGQTKHLNKDKKCYSCFLNQVAPPELMKWETKNEG